VREPLILGHEVAGDVIETGGQEQLVVFESQSFVVPRATP
jgi:D-arabinose 1-dehydrogenase-like Zn-dependent alcohol dehydrogenase